MDRLAAMTLFLSVAAAGSLSAAARKDGLPLATVSRRLADLEAHLGTRLLLRGSRSITLTDAGQGYLAACRRVLEDVAAAERAARGEYAAPRGHLVVTAPLVFGRLHLLPVVTAFLQAYPQIDLRLILGDNRMQIMEDHVDVALRIGPLPDSGLVAARLGTVARITCASPAYLARRGAPAMPEALAGHDCILFDPLAPGGEWLFGRAKLERRIPVVPRLTVTTAEAAVDAAASGLGVTRVLSYQAAAAVRSGALCRILQDAEPDPWPVHLVHAGQGPMAQKLRVFLDAAVPQLRAGLAALEKAASRPTGH